MSLTRQCFVSWRSHNLSLVSRTGCRPTIVHQPADYGKMSHRFDGIPTGLMAIALDWIWL